MRHIFYKAVKFTLPILLFLFITNAHGVTPEGVPEFPQDFVKIPGKLKQLDIGKTEVWGVDSNNNIKKRSIADTKSDWESVPGSLIWVSIGENDAVWGVNGNQKECFFKYDRTQKNWAQKMNPSTVLNLKKVYVQLDQEYQNVAG